MAYILVRAVAGPLASLLTSRIYVSSDKREIGFEKQLAPPCP